MATEKNLNNIVHLDEDKFSTLSSGGTITGYGEYNEADVYAVELSDDLEVAADGSGMSVNTDNQLIADVRGAQVNGTDATITDGKLQLSAPTVATWG